MKLQFKHQPFQAEAADAVCDVFCGQPYRTVTYRRDLGDLTGVQISTSIRTKHRQRVSALRSKAQREQERS